jgi:hypothetical protein
MISDKPNFPMEMLRRVSFYLADQYPHIKNDFRRITPERRACEIILALKDLCELTSSQVEENPRRNRL